VFADRCDVMLPSPGHVAPAPPACLALRDAVCSLGTPARKRKYMQVRRLLGLWSPVNKEADNVLSARTTYCLGNWVFRFSRVCGGGGRELLTCATRLRARWPINPSSISWRRKTLFPFPQLPNRFPPPQVPHQMGTWVSFPGRKVAGAWSWLLTSFYYPR
jgi:hypothetical protein